MADQIIKSNIDDQLARLLLQLQDLEDMREDLDEDEYTEGKADTLKQMEEFEQSLSKMMTGDMTLVSKLGAAQQAIQTAIAAHTHSSDAKQLFENKEASSLRRRLATLDEDLRLGKISATDHQAQAVEVLRALEKAGEVLSVGEKGQLEARPQSEAYSAATEDIDSSVMKTATTATTQTFGGR